MTAAAIAASGLPVLIPDTCALLDIIQAPVRDGFRAEDAMAIRRVLAALNCAPPSLAVVVPELVQVEFADNVARAEQEVTQGLARLDGLVEAAAQRIGWLDDTAPHPTPALSQRGHPASGRALVDCAIARALMISDGIEERERAFLRVRVNAAPARRGSQSINDCLIVETALSFVRQYRFLGGSAPVAFLSSNSKDYMEGQSVRPPLAGQFDELDITFVSRWSALLGWMPSAS